MSIKTNFPISRPSLNLDFANTKVLDPRVTFARASTATYYDGKTVAKAEENLCLYSQDFDVTNGWTTAGGTVAANTATAPDGTTTAEKFTEDSTALTHRFLQASGNRTPTVSGTTYTFSVYLKYIGRQYIQLNLTAFKANCRVIFDIQNGTVTDASTATASVVSVGNGWYRCVATVVADQNGTGPQITVGGNSAATGNGEGYTGSGADAFYIWGAQLEQRAAVSAYTPTTSSAITNYLPVLQTALSNVPRFDHDPITGESKGLLIEEQRTNLLSASQDFEAPVWIKNTVAINANSVVAPDGTLTADKIVEGITTNTQHDIRQQQTTSGSGSYVGSFYVKAGERTRVSMILFGTNFVYTESVFDLTNGSVITGSGSITSVGNGWYRCSLVGSASAAGNVNLYARLVNTGFNTTYTGDGTSGLYIWGAQLEAGAFATSYVPTPLSFTSRASTATYRGTNGLIQTAAINTARYEPNSSGGSNLLLESAATNLLTYSSQFEAASWTKTQGGGASVTANAATAPDGTVTADKLVENAALGNHLIYQDVVITGSGRYTGSYYVKAAERTKVALIVQGGGLANQTVIFDLSTGSVVSGTGVIAPIGGGWFRISVSPSVNTSGQSASIKPAICDASGSTSYTGDGTSGLYIWGAQLETGSVATSYVPSVETFTSRASTATYYGSNGLIQTAASNVARINYNPANLSVPGKLLLEPAATNLLTYSEQFDNAAWSKSNATISANAVVAPDGSNTADQLDLSANSNSQVWQSVTLTAASYTLSVWVKTASGTKTFRLKYYNGTADAFSENFTATTDWKRFSFVVTGAAVAGNIGVVNSSTGESGLIYIWGAQLEAGTGASSYIPTTTAQVTRAADVSTSAQGTRAADVYSAPTVTRSADVASMTGTNFSSWFNAAEGTIYTDCTANGSAGYSSVIWDGTNNNYIINRAASSGTAMAVSSGGAIQANIGSSALVSKIASGYKANDFSVSVNGGAVSTDASGSLPIVTQLSIGSNNANYINGHLKRLAYYPKRLSDSQLQAVTA